MFFADHFVERSFEEIHEISLAIVVEPGFQRLVQNQTGDLRLQAFLRAFRTRTQVQRAAREEFEPTLRQVFERRETDAPVLRGEAVEQIGRFDMARQSGALDDHGGRGAAQPGGLDIGLDFC